MENNDFLSSRLDERRGLFKGVLGKKNRQVQALQDACKALKEENEALSAELKKKETVVRNLSDYLNQCIAASADAGITADDQEVTSEKA